MPKICLVERVPVLHLTVMNSRYPRDPKRFPVQLLKAEAEPQSSERRRHISGSSHTTFSYAKGIQGSQLKDKVLVWIQPRWRSDMDGKKGTGLSHDWKLKTEL